MNKLIGCSIAALLFGASAALAQPVFKSTMPDGKIVYGEKPVPGAAKVETMEPPPAKTGISTAISPEEKARAEAAAKQRAATVSADTARQARLDAARKAVKDAELAIEKGKEPLPGERQGLAGGGSRLTESYFERQKSLENQLAKARQSLAELERGGR